MKGKLMVLKKAAALILAAVLVAGLGMSADFGTKQAKADALPVIFIGDNTVGTGTGASAADPLQGDEIPSGTASYSADRPKSTALYKAWERLRQAGGGTIVFTKEYEITKDMANNINNGWSQYNMMMRTNEAAPMRDITITYTSVYNGIDYRQTNGAKVVLADSVHLTFPTATVTENISFQAKGTNDFIAAGTCDLTLSTGTNFIKYANAYPKVLGNYYRADQEASYASSAAHVTIDLGEGNTIGDVFAGAYQGPNNLNSSAVIDIKSGTVVNVYGDSYNNNTYYGPTTINVTGGKITGEIAGASKGFNASSTNKTILMNVTGGDFSACTGILIAKSTVGASNKPTEMTIDASALANAVTLSELKAAIRDENIKLSEPTFDPSVIFIGDNTVGTGTGASAADPLQGDEIPAGTPTYGSTRPSSTALYKAWQKLRESGGGTIVFTKEYEITKDMANNINSGWGQYNMMMRTNDAAPMNDVTITYTSVYNGIDYRQMNGAKVVLADSVHLTFPTATVTENISFQAKGTNDFIAAGTCDLTLSAGTNFIKYANTYPKVLGNYYRADQDAGYASRPAHITIDLGEGNTIGDVFAGAYQGPSNLKSSTVIDIKSGTVTNVYGDSYNNNTYYGPTTINISGGKIAGEIAGAYKGFNTSGTEKTVTINVTGGDFSTCTGILFAKSGVASGNQPTSVTIDARKADRETVARLKEIKETNVTLLYNQIVSGTVTLGESVAMNINVDLTGITDPSVKVTMDGNTETITEKKDNGNGTYAYTLKLDPSQLADTFTAELLDGETVVSTLEDYSVKAYCDALAAKYADDAKLMALIADLMEYAAAAQAFTAHNTANPANDLSWVAAHKTTFSNVTTDRVVTGTGDEGASFAAAYLNLYDSVSVRFTVGGTDKENLTAKLFKNGAETTFENVGELAEIRSERIAPTEYDSTFEAALYRNDTEIQRVKYSVKSYVASYQDADDAVLKNLVQRLYQYGVSAKAYQA